MTEDETLVRTGCRESLVRAGMSWLAVTVDRTCHVSHWKLQQMSGPVSITRAFGEPWQLAIQFARQWRTLAKDSAVAQS